MALSDAEKFDWLNNDNHRIVLMDLEYYDDTHTLQTARFASYPYVQPIGDVWNTFSNLIYDDIISNVPNIVTRIDADSTVGTIDLLNTDGEFDMFLNEYTIIGHSIQLSIGGEGWIRDNFIVILDGIVSGIGSSSPENIQLTLRDKKEVLNITLQEQLYIKKVLPGDADEYWDDLMDAAALSTSWTGPLSGDQSLYSRAQAVLPPAVENTHVPIALGKCFNIEPVMVDSWNHIYHIHDSPEGIVAVTEVRSNGVPLIASPTAPQVIWGVPLSSYWGNSGNGFLVGEEIHDTNEIIVGIVTGWTGTIGVDYVLLYTPTVSNFYLNSGRFKGQTSGSTADVTTAPTLQTPSTVGQYEIDLSLGMIRLLDHEHGTQITCDIIGQDGPSTLRAGGAPTLIEYSAADIIEWLLLEKGAIDPDDICYETFNHLGTKPFTNTDSLGFYSKDESTVLDAATRVINSVGGFMRFKSALCKLQIIRLEDPLGKYVTGDLNLVSDDIVEDGISIAVIEEPKKSITLGYKKNWKTQDEGALAGAITDSSSPHYDASVLNSYMNEYSTVYESLGLDQLEYPLAEDVELIETSIWDVNDAQTELDRRVVLRGQRRRVIRINSLATSFTYDIGDIVFITHDRFGLGFGKEAIIIGIEESPTSKRVNLDVWL